MAGLAGILGGHHSLDGVIERLAPLAPETNHVFEEDSFEVGVSLHDRFDEAQPARTEGGARVWIQGQIYGHGSDEGYVSRHVNWPEASRAEYCARLYEDHGMSFVDTLNGEFVGAVHEPNAGTVSIFTDRLSSRALFNTRTDGDGVLFSTRIQSLPGYPGFEPVIDREYLYEWFTLDRALGTRTPLDGVEQVPPASVLTVDLTEHSVSTRTYWRPRYRPVDRSLDSVVEKFISLFTEVLEERTADDATYGLLLSGGSDSRAILAGVDDVKCYTMAGWMNREASLARRCAEAVDCEFTLLERDREYQPRALRRNPAISNFVGRFQHAHATGFREQLADEIDVLMSGQFCDTFFKGHFLPTPEVPVDQISTIDIPVEKSIDSVEAYVEHLTDGRRFPEYLRTPPRLEDVLRREIKLQDGVRSHGIRYDSLRNLVLSGEYYPLTNQPDSFFYDSLTQMLPYRSPFIDTRLLDLHLTIPVKYLLRRNIPNRAIERLAPELAAMPHSTTGVPLKYPFPVQYLGQKLSTFRRRFLPVRDPPESHQRQTSWTDHKSLIREHEYIEEFLTDHAATIKSCEFLDSNAVDRVYQSHLDGEQRMPELYSLLTFLGMPLTTEVDLGEASATDE